MGMDPGPPSTVAERFSTLLRWLGLAIDARRLFGLGPPLISLVIVRFGRLNQLFDRIASGRFVPRHRVVTVPRLQRYARRPRRRCGCRENSAGCCRWCRMRSATAPSSNTCSATRRWRR